MYSKNTPLGAYSSSRNMSRCGRNCCTSRFSECHRIGVQVPCCINHASSGICKQWIRRYRVYLAVWGIPLDWSLVIMELTGSVSSCRLSIARELVQTTFITHGRPRTSTMNITESFPALICLSKVISDTVTLFIFIFVC